MDKWTNAIGRRNSTLAELLHFMSAERLAAGLVH